MAVTGFCWGGRITWLYCGHNPKVKAGAAWYGRLVGDKSTLNPRQPIDIAAALKVPVLGLYGGADPGIPPDTTKQIDAEMKAAGKKDEIVTYPDTPHGFFADYRPSYRKEASEDGWKRMTAWFKQYVG